MQGNNAGDTTPGGIAKHRGRKEQPVLAVPPTKMGLPKEQPALAVLHPGTQLPSEQIALAVPGRNKHNQKVPKLPPKDQGISFHPRSPVPLNQGQEQWYPSPAHAGQGLIIPL